MEERLCDDCGEPLVGRPDKKFCSDQCRNGFNNRLNSDNNNFMRNINNILRKNRRIMADLTPNGKVTLSKEKVLDKGLNFDFHTHIYDTMKNTRYFFCYEYGYFFHGKDYMTIVLRKKTNSLDKD